MAVAFVQVNLPPLEQFTASAPDGAIIGLVGEDDAGVGTALRLAAGLEEPSFGKATATEPVRLVRAQDPLSLGAVGTLLLDHALAQHDRLVRARACLGLEQLRRNGTTILLASHDEELIRQLCDEAWWVHRGRLEARGDPREVLEKYNRHIAQRLREWGASVHQSLAPSMRRGDGRAAIQEIHTLDAGGRPTMVWRSGETISVRVLVRFAQAVDDPVIGIMIRTRIGFEVYGTNTELENVRFGPVAAGEMVQATFSFRCDLCPQEYTLTAASHDPYGVWHDWLEDALAFSVADSRYTAGVANLRATVKVDKLGESGGGEPGRALTGPVNFKGAT